MKTQKHTEDNTKFQGIKGLSQNSCALKEFSQKDDMVMYLVKAG